MAHSAVSRLISYLHLEIAGGVGWYILSSYKNETYSLGAATLSRELRKYLAITAAQSNAIQLLPNGRASSA